MKNRYYIETYGCQMNFALSDQLTKELEKIGMKEVYKPEIADLIIVNACSVRKHAEDKVFNRINILNSLKKKNKNLKIIVTGCFAQNQKEKIKADFVLGTYKISEIPKIITNGKEKYINTDFDQYKFLKPVRNRELPFQAYIDITVGCNNFCSYCIVPYLRGPQISRRSKEIIEDAKRLADEGVVELFLLGQNVNSYGKDNNEIGFAELLYKIHNIDGIKRIKFLTSHPKDFNDEIIDAVCNLEKVSKWFHLPIQSGSDRILKLMNRKYTVEHYLRIIEKIKSYKIDFAISTDFLVGFPSETEEDFLKTIEIAEKIKFDEAFMFKYSDRNYTASYSFENKISEEVKNERLKTLIEIQNRIEKENIKKHIGKERNILIEMISKRNSEQILGRDELNRTVILKNENLKIGNFYKAKIVDYKGITLIGELLV